jgi:hypothetical protein
MNLREVWNQRVIPVVVRRDSPPLWVRLPFAKDNGSWLRSSSRRKPVWDPEKRRWEVPRIWFEGLVRRLLSRYGRVYLVQRTKELQKCAPACWNAEGTHCECSCLGARHGTGQPGGRWYEVSATFAFHWERLPYSCRLLTEDSRQSIQGNLR